MKTRDFYIAGMTWLLFVQAAVAQTSVPPPPRPVGGAQQVPAAAASRKHAGSGPSLQVTMQFIQDTMNNHGTVGYVWTRSDWNGLTFRNYYTISEVGGDATTCSLHKTETTVTVIEAAQGFSYNENGQPVSGDDLTRSDVQVSTVSLKTIASIRIEAMQDQGNRSFAESAHPEITNGVTPAVYSLTLTSPRPVFSFHETFTKGKQQPIVSDTRGKEDHLTFRDEDTANRLAKALVHAVELCGGGSREPF
jgi:hypothetical protein